MARIPEEEIERLKKEIPIERLVGGFGIELRRTGANLVGRCPFHDDRKREKGGKGEKGSGKGVSLICPGNPGTGKPGDGREVPPTPASA